MQLCNWSRNFIKDLKSQGKYQKICEVMPVLVLGEGYLLCLRGKDVLSGETPHAQEYLKCLSIGTLNHEFFICLKWKLNGF